MKLTQEQINQIKQDPFYKLLAALTGDETILDDAIKEIEKEDNTAAGTEEPQNKLPLTVDDVATIIDMVTKYKNFLAAGNLGSSSVPYRFFDLFQSVLSLLIGDEATAYLTDNALEDDNINKIMNTLNLYYNE